MPESLVFYAFAGLMIFSSILVVTLPNPIGSAVGLIVTLFIAAAFYAKLGADFAAAIQVLVYAGAIMVLFLFVIMLLNLAPEQLRGPRITPAEFAVLLLAIGGFMTMSTLVLRSPPSVELGNFAPEQIATMGGNTRVVGLSLFQDYIWPFELASLLILLAIVASVVIAKKDKKNAQPKGV